MTKHSEFSAAQFMDWSSRRPQSPQRGSRGASLYKSRRGFCSAISEDEIDAVGQGTRDDDDKGSRIHHGSQVQQAHAVDIVAEHPGRRGRPIKAIGVNPTIKKGTTTSAAVKYLQGLGSVKGGSKGGDVGGGCGSVGSLVNGKGAGGGKTGDVGGDIGMGGYRNDNGGGKDARGDMGGGGASGVGPLGGKGPGGGSNSGGGGSDSRPPLQLRRRQSRASTSKSPSPRAPSPQQGQAKRVALARAPMADEKPVLLRWCFLSAPCQDRRGGGEEKEEEEEEEEGCSKNKLIGSHTTFSDFGLYCICFLCYDIRRHRRRRRHDYDLPVRRRRVMLYSPLLCYTACCHFSWPYARPFMLRSVVMKCAIVWCVLLSHCRVPCKRISCVVIVIS